MTGTGVLDESTIQLTGMNGVSTTPVNAFNGLNIAYKHTVDGTETQDFINLRYIGATSSSSSTPGLVPLATSSEREKFLRADGTWKYPPSASIFTGSTAGLVPDAQAEGASTRYLRMDGTWTEIILP